MSEYRARCASSRNPDWPFWYVEKDGLSVGWRDKFGPKLASKEECIREAERLNALETSA